MLNGLRLLLLFAATSFAANFHPIVEAQTGYLLGGVGGGKWIKAETAQRLVKGGEKYLLYSLNERLGTTTGGKPESAEEPCPETLRVAMKPKPANKGVLAIAGDWNALPRVPKSQDVAQPEYVKAVREFLTAKGIRSPKVKITQILRIDLEGDGEDEVLISGTNYFSSAGIPSSASAGSYSFVILRRVIAGKVRTQLLAGDFYTKAKNFNAPPQYAIAAVLDADGDGTMEIIVHGHYYEGGWISVFRCTPTKVEEVLEVGCGA